MKLTPRERQALDNPHDGGDAVVLAALARRLLMVCQAAKVSGRCDRGCFAASNPPQRKR